MANKLIMAIEAKGYTALDTTLIADPNYETILHVYVTKTGEELGEWDSDDNDWVEYEEVDDYSGNMYCDTYGVCGGYRCPNYIKCHA